MKETISKLYLKVEEPKEVVVIYRWFYDDDTKENHEEMLDQIEAEYYEYT